jgi:hypothetical protein
VGATQELLDEAGCAVNELTKNDYGYDLHVHLPEWLPDPSADAWPMSPHAALVQVKGGSYVDSGVRLSVDRWDYLRAAMTPVYLAAVPQNSNSWIASVEELLPAGGSEIRTGSYEARPAHPSWDPAAFVSEAVLGAQLGSAHASVVARVAA